MEEQNLEQENQNTLTWDMVRETRNTLLLDSEKMYNFDSPDALKAAWTEYKQELRDIPQKFKHLEDLQLIEWPLPPTDHIQTLTLSRLAPH